VPWFLRAGKKLPNTLVEVRIQFKPASTALFEDSGAAGGRANYLRLRLQPTTSIALAARVKHPGKEFVGEQRELFLCDDLSGEESAYERLLGDAMAGDASLFTSAEAVEAAWTVVDRVLVDHPEVVPYAPGSWGPKEADALVAAAGGWIDPDPEAGCAPQNKDAP